MASIQGWIANKILKLMTGGITMEDIQTYAQCQRTKLAMGGEKADMAKVNSQVTADKEKETATKAAGEEGKAQEGIEEAERNVQDADTLTREISEQEQAVVAEEAATKVFIDEVIAEKKQQEEQKKAEREKKKAAQKDKGGKSDGPAPDDLAASAAADAGGEPQEDKPDPGVGATVHAAAALISSKIEGYSGQLAKSVTDEGAVLTDMAKKRDKGASEVAATVTAGGVQTVNAWKVEMTPTQVEMQKIREREDREPEHGARARGHAMREASTQLDESVQATSASINMKFQNAFDVVSARGGSQGFMGKVMSLKEKYDRGHPAPGQRRRPTRGLSDAEPDRRRGIARRERMTLERPGCRRRSPAHLRMRHRSERTGSGRLAAFGDDSVGRGGA